MVAAAEVAVCVYMGDVTVTEQLSEVSSLLLLWVEKMKLRPPTYIANMLNPGRHLAGFSSIS